MERKKSQRYGSEFRRQAVERMNACDNIVALARELGVSRRVLYAWRDRMEQASSSPGRSRELILRKQILKLKRLLANKTLEMDFFRHALQRVGARRRQNFHPCSDKGIYDEIRARMPLQGSIGVERMCQLAEVSRAGFYRYLRRGWQWEEEVALRSAVQDVVIDHRWRYGYRRVTEELRARGMIVNHKRIARIMREDNLLVLRQDHGPDLDGSHTLRAARVYLNLAARMTLLGPNQLWVADITYIRLAREFVYLAVVLDVFSRKVIGWALGRSLKAQLPICALERAIANRRPPPGVVHHSDQGVQYASKEYMETLRKHKMLPSMSRPGNPYDNATCESFLKTLKREEINATIYRDFEDLQKRLDEFIEGYYNVCRLHSALDYRSPEDFEKECLRESQRTSAAAMMTFFEG